MVHHCMLPLTNITLTIDIAVASIKERSWGAELLMAGDLNVNLMEPEVERREVEIVAVLTMAGL